MADNKYIKDGLGNLFFLRMKDVSQGGDGSLQRSMILSSLLPPEFGTGGIYQHCAKSGTLPNAAAMTAAPIYTFRWPGSIAAPFLFARLRRIRMSAYATNVFAPGLATFDLVAARAYSAIATGGMTADFSGENNQLATAMPAPLASIVWSATAPLTPGTRVLDAAPLDSFSMAAPTVANTPFTATRLTLYEKSQSDFPLTLDRSEGFIIAATLPAGGPWNFAVTTEWDELAS
jgi:hypothetical protein